MVAVFISYRRDDNPDAVGRIYDRLVEYFDHESVFMDTETIPQGMNFQNHIEQELSKCDVLLAVIGDRWMKLDDRKMSRLDEPNDFVRFEITTALRLGIPVIPVVVGTAQIPTSTELPEEIVEISRLNAAEVRSGGSFERHIEDLIHGIETARHMNSAKKDKPRETEWTYTIPKNIDPTRENIDLVIGAIQLGNIWSLEYDYGRTATKELRDALGYAAFTPAGTSMSDLSLVAGIAATHPQYVPPGIAYRLADSSAWSEVRGHGDALLKSCEGAWTNSLGNIILEHTPRINISIADFIAGLSKYYSANEHYDLRPWIVDAINLEGERISETLAGWAEYSAAVEQLPQLATNLILLPKKNGIAVSATTWIGEFELADDKDSPVGSIRKSHSDASSSLVTNDGLMLFEDLLNTKCTTEDDMQIFFEEHPEFLSLLEYSDVYPQIYLRHEDDSVSIPDFLLIPQQHSRPQLLEIGDPFDDVAVGRRGWRNLASSVFKARTRLIEYSTWFESASNRRRAAEKWGAHVYRPDLALIVGRSKGFLDEKERRELEAHAPDVRIFTYDDILNRSKLYNKMHMHLPST